MIVASDQLVSTKAPFSISSLTTAIRPLDIGAGILKARTVRRCIRMLHAAGSGHEVVVNLLLEKDAELDSKDEDGMTLLS
jgi:ankyrin repeat protein